ncbi:MAG TPA: ABC transporter transmembrane domain-containing protein, partial [Solirubrobacteraceae bacterium]
LLAVGTAGTRLERVPERALDDPAHADEVLALLDRWIVALSSGLTPEPPPREAAPIEPGTTATLTAKGVVVGGADVVWVKPTGTSVAFLGADMAAVLPADTWSPLTPRTWIVASATGSLEAIDTVTARQRGAILPGLMAFHGLALGALAARIRRGDAAERERLTRAGASDARVVAGAVEGLAAVLPGRRGVRAATTLTGDTLLDAVGIVGTAAGIAVQPDHHADGAAAPRVRLAAIARASRFRTRSVTLTGAWWRRDNGPLLGWLKDRTPVALIARSPRGYVVVDPLRGEQTRVTAAVAAGLAPDAIMFYRPLPERALSAGDLLRFACRGLGRDAAAIVLLGLAGGLLGMLIPIATGIVFDTLIPSADRGRLFQTTVGLVVAALAAGIFGIVRSFALLRVSGKIDGGLQAAIWDRVLSLPMSFFRDYSAGDLALRANAVSSIQDALTGVVLSSLLSVVFSLLSVALMFYYDVRLAVVSLLLVALMLVTAGVANRLQLQRLRQAFRLQGLISGLVLQLIDGIAKLRVAGAESRAFA